MGPFRSVVGKHCVRSARQISAVRTFSTTPSVYFEPVTPPKLPQEAVSINSRANDTAKRHREIMKSKPLNPHMTNTTSTIANEFPSLGADKPPADMLTSVDPSYTPKDSVPENTMRMTGGTQAPAPNRGPNAELDVGEIEGGKFKVEPLRREGEAEETLRARLIYQSRKRGTLESDLLLSTFADANLAKMSMSQMEQYDLFLDENDWDIYYWATQQPSPTSRETAEGQGPELANPSAAGKGMSKEHREASGKLEPVKPGQGEWQQTVGAFKPAYRPVPARWKNSEILMMLRKHVIDRSAGGVHEDLAPKVEGEALSRGVKSSGGGGLGFMPELRDLNAEAKS